MEVFMLIGSRNSRSLPAMLAVLALVGCGGGGGGGHGGSASAYFSLGIYDVIDTAQARPLTCDEVAGGQLFIALTGRDGYQYMDGAPANCSPGSEYYFEASTPTVPAGDYIVDFYLYGNPSVYGNNSSAIGSSRMAGTLYLAPGVTDYRSTTTLPEPIWTESFFFDWALRTGCRPGELVEFAFARPNSDFWIFRDFDCTTGSSGTSYPIPLDYTSAKWNLSLLDVADQTLDSISGGVVSVPDGADIDLGTLAFRTY
jgi:hypothetical protein